MSLSRLFNPVEDDRAQVLADLSNFVATCAKGRPDEYWLRAAAAVAVSRGGQLLVEYPKLRRDALKRGQAAFDAHKKSAGGDP